MDKSRSRIGGYLLLGATAGAIAVVISSRAIPIMLSRMMPMMMRNMMLQMGGEGCDPEEAETDYSFGEAQS